MQLVVFSASASSTWLCFSRDMLVKKKKTINELLASVAAAYDWKVR